uniref:Transcription factor E2F7 n=1 Tax=Naja naja TaxID=35670 RepID=A0A8C6X839_NAJNA
MELNCLTLKDLISPRHGKIDYMNENGDSAQKENIFDRPRMTPKTPMKNEPIDLSKQKSYTPERSPITPVKLTDRPLADPWTPTANLKMLISAASPDMRDREKKKELFRPIENNEFSDALPDSSQCDIADDGTADEYEKQRPSRKQKSLGLLCQKFLARYPSYPLSAEKTTISLDEVASSLGVERRRIYDIVNVLESLDLVSRVAKNQYCWHGRHSLSQTLKKLQDIGELQKYEELMTSFQQKELDFECRFGEHKKESFVDFQDRQLLDFSETDCPSASANSRKDKSLRIMSQKFVMLFLVSKTKIVTLDIAAKILIEESQDTADHSKFKTKVRRLYDIANVLTSLGLIKKVHVTEERGRKPAFKWIGPVEFTGNNGDIKMEVRTCATLTEVKRPTRIPHQACSNRKDRLSRHASFSVPQPSETVKRKVSSEPSSPHKERQGKYDYCSKMINLASVCCQNLEDNKSIEAARNLDIISSFSVFPVPEDSDYCANVFPCFPKKTNSDASHWSLPNGINNQNVLSSAVSASKTETGETNALPSQSFVCLPSPSLYMLCGKLHGSHSQANVPEKRSEDTEGHVSPCSLETAKSPVNSRKRVPPTAAPLEEAPIAKRQSLEQNDGPLSLVVSKRSIPKPLTCGVPQGSVLSPFLFNIYMKPLGEIIRGEVSPICHCCFVFILDRTGFYCIWYLFLSFILGLNGLNFLFPTNQASAPVSLPSSHLPSLNVPCMMVPSTALGPFPVIYSSAGTSQLHSSSSASFPNVTCMNFSMPSLTSTAPLFIGTPTVLTPNSSQLPTLEPHQQFHSAVHLNPLLGSACNSVKTDSSICMGHPVTLLNLPQPSTTPLTPKNVRPTTQETLFKTPGSLEDTIIWRKNEGNQSRTSSSVQRRLEISSKSSD